MHSSAKNLRKAAVLLASLEAEHADALLRQMSPAQAHVLREAVDHLGQIDAAEQECVIEEFFRIGTLVPELDAAGIELTAPLPQPLHRGGSATGADDRPTTTPFRFLHEAPAAKLAPFLEREHPQTVAVVISQLPPDRAAEVLSHLAGPLQIDVARRLVQLEETDTEVLREVERGLESWLCSQVQGETHKSAGVAALASILGAADPQARHRILANLARYDRQLAQRVDVPASPALVFADLECLDAAALAHVLQHADREILVLALAGAAPQFAERALELLGRDGHAVRRALANLGPTRLSDVEEAQRRLAELAGQLEQRGEITPDLHGRLSLAV